MKELEVYKHIVQYYETDMMGFVHHSNYIRWMEESRVDFLRQLKIDYTSLEKDGIVSPTVEVNCRYRKSTTFEDIVFVTVTMTEFKGVKLKFAYIMKNAEGEVVAEASSVHCFIDKNGRPIRLAKEYPEYYSIIMDNIVWESDSEG